MSIRPENLNTDALLLYPLGNGTSSHETAPVYAFPQDDEDSDEGQGSALGDGEEEGIDLKLSLQVDAKAKLSNESVETDVKDTNGTSAAPINPTLLPAGYGAAIIASFLAMIKYLNEMAQQGYQVTVYSANAMIGTDNKPGLIQSWVNAGMDSAQAQGDQMRNEAIGFAVSGAVCGLSLLGSVGGFIRNSVSCTSEIGGGMFQNKYGKISLELENAESYRAMLNEPTKAELVAQDGSEKLLNQAAPNAQAEVQQQQVEVETKVGLDSKSEALKKAMTKDAIKTYKSKKDENGGNLSQEAQADRDEKIKLAAEHLDEGERTAAKKKADKWIESLQNQRGQCEGAQNQWGGLMNQISQGGQTGGQALGGFTKSEKQIESQKQKTISDSNQQTNQATGDVKEKGTQQAQAKQQEMGQTAQALAQALASQTQSRA